MEDRKIAADCSDLAQRLFELCKACDAQGNLPREQTNELLKLLIAFLNEYKQLVEWLTQAQIALEQWRQAHKELEQYVQDVGIEQFVTKKYLDQKGLLEDFIQFAHQLSIEEVKKLEVVQGGKGAGE